MIVERHNLGAERSLRGAVLLAGIQMPGKIFINYRRDDSASHALNIAQYMERAFGSRNVFIDIDRIQAGQNFEDVLGQRLDQCSVMLVIMGPKWAGARDDAGVKRLTNPNDWVRLEIVRALQRKIKVIPILVGGLSSLPDPVDVPDALKPLLKLQCAVVTANGFRYEVAGIAKDIRPALGWQQRIPAWAGFAAAAIALIALAVYLIDVRLTGIESTRTPGAGLAFGTGFEAQLSEKCRSELHTWRSTPAIGAFAIASNGTCGSSSDQLQLRDARTNALAACGRQASDCRIVELVEGDWSLTPKCEAQYSEWKSDTPLKVFAVARSGHCSSVTAQKTLEEARTNTLATCERLSGNCRVHDVDQGNWVPIPECKIEYEKYMKSEPARAFALSRSGSCGWSDDQMNPAAATKSALAACADTGSECRITESFDGKWELDKGCKELAAKWTRMRGRGSFAAGMSGGCGYSHSYSSTADADAEALSQCKKNEGNDCKIVSRH